jgi:hypothetical protein
VRLCRHVSLGVLFPLSKPVAAPADTALGHSAGGGRAPSGRGGGRRTRAHGWAPAPARGRAADRYASALGSGVAGGDVAIRGDLISGCDDVTGGHGVADQRTSTGRRSDGDALAVPDRRAGGESGSGAVADAVDGYPGRGLRGDADAGVFTLSGTPKTRLGYV